MRLERVKKKRGNTNNAIIHFSKLYYITFKIVLNDQVKAETNAETLKDQVKAETNISSMIEVSGVTF